jgi:pimeloyl-ACP methyl ester carboxylesterase
MTSGGFAPLADLLAEDHTVVTYDPHGVGESTVDDRSLAVTPEIEADDLADVIDALGGRKADVFGSSGGAVAGLALAARHPDKVDILIAHEPPVADLLPDTSHIRTAIDGVEDAYHAYGAGAAWGKFVSAVMHDGPVTEAGVPDAQWPPPGSSDEAAAEGEGGGGEAATQPAPSAKQQADDELFFLRMLKPFTRYQPPVELLRSGEPRVIVAVGAASSGEIAARSARALAEQLGATPAVFPGNHGGFTGDPEGFATKIRELLAKPS